MDRQSDPSSVETVAVVPRSSSSSFTEEGRFVPRTLPGGRYRIIALPGRGGMGEVYRATGLTLGQSVALKFLPEEAARNQRLLERAHRGRGRVVRLANVHPLGRMLLRRNWQAAAVATVFGIFSEGGVINSHNWQLKAVVAFWLSPGSRGWLDDATEAR